MLCKTVNIALEITEKRDGGNNNRIKVQKKRTNTGGPAHRENANL